MSRKCWQSKHPSGQPKNIFHRARRNAVYMKRFMDAFFPFLKDFKIIDPDPKAMDERLRAPLGLWELFGITFCMTLVGIFIWLINIKAGYPVDFLVFMSKGISPEIFYGYWILPVFSLLKLLPFQIAYSIWCLVNILCLVYTVRVFGGKAMLVLISYQFFTSLYYGNISGILAGGLALCWWGLSHRAWNVAGLGLLIAMTKYQVGLLGLILIWYAAISWREFFRLMLVPLFIGLLSVIIYPYWPITMLHKLSGFSFMNLGITLWIYIGAWCLIFWIPALLLPLKKPARFLALFCLISFATPYFQHIDLLTLFAFPMGWLPLLGNIGYLFPFIDKNAVRLIAIIPILLYLICILPATIQQLRRLFPLLQKSTAYSNN